MSSTTYLSEIYKDTKDLNQGNPQFQQMKNDDKRDVIKAPSYNPIIPINPNGQNNPNTAIGFPRPEVQSRDQNYNTNIMDNNPQSMQVSQSPQPNLNANELSEIQRYFTWIYGQTPDLHDKYPNMQEVLNNVPLMKNIIEQYEAYVNEKSETANRSQQSQSSDDINEVVQEPMDNYKSPSSSSVWLMLLEEIKFPVIMGVIYYILGTKSVQIYLNNMFPMFSEYYNFKLTLMTILFIIISIVVIRLINWINV